MLRFPVAGDGGPDAGGRSWAPAWSRGEDRTFAGQASMRPYDRLIACWRRGPWALRQETVEAPGGSFTRCSVMSRPAHPTPGQLCARKPTGCYPAETPGMHPAGGAHAEIKDYLDRGRHDGSPAPAAVIIGGGFRRPSARPRRAPVRQRTLIDRRPHHPSVRCTSARPGSCPRGHRRPAAGPAP